MLRKKTNPNLLENVIGLLAQRKKRSPQGVKIHGTIDPNCLKYVVDALANNNLANRDKPIKERVIRNMGPKQIKKIKHVLFITKNKSDGKIKVLNNNILILPGPLPEELYFRQ